MIWTWRHLDQGFGLRYILLDFNWKSFGQRFIITLIRYFTGVRPEKTWTTNLDCNYYILRDLDLKLLGLRIWILIVIYGSRLENTWTKNLDYDYLDFTGLWFRIMINLLCLKRSMRTSLTSLIWNLTNYLSIRSLNTKSRKVELLAKAYLI